MQRLAILIAAVTSLGAFSLTAMAAPPTGLNAPVQPSTPTVGSEIKRGADAADRCGTLYTMPTSADGFAACVDARQSANRQSAGVGYEAFDIGLYFMAKANIGVAIDILSKAGRDVAVLRARMNLYEVRYRQARDKLNLTDAEAEKGAYIGGM
ncbi:hypothetical protein TomTYG75_26140 [Sphingobium sp. TomTYG75]